VWRELLREASHFLKLVSRNPRDQSCQQAARHRDSRRGKKNSALGAGRQEWKKKIQPSLLEEDLKLSPNS